MNSIEGDMAGVASTQTEEMSRLEEQAAVTNNASTMDRLRQRISYLENRGLQLKADKDQLHTVYQRHLNQQVVLVQHLVDKMQQLESIGAADLASLSCLDPETLPRLKALTKDLLEQVRLLESSIHQNLVP